MRQQRRGSGCTSILATLMIMALVISGVVWLSPALDLGNVRDTVFTDRLDGVPGSGGEGYTFLSTAPNGSPVTWACDADIELVVNPEGAPEGYADLVAGAVGTVNQEMGRFRFMVTGETEDREFVGRGSGPVLVGWADAEEVPELSGRTAGLGGPAYVPGPGGGGRAVGGMVALDRNLPRGWFSQVDEEAVLAHELLHVLGLGHTEDPAQLMASTQTGGTELGDGDRAGIAALEQAACG